jgi:hypothetical protein
MRLLHAGVDTSVIALWLGHENVETTQIYLHDALAITEAALARTKPATGKPGRYKPNDALLAFLEGLCLSETRNPNDKRLHSPPDPSRHGSALGMREVSTPHKARLPLRSLSTLRVARRSCPRTLRLQER